jgi:hypothetical protein
MFIKCAALDPIHLQIHPLALSSLLHFTHLLLQNLPCQIQPIIKCAALDPIHLQIHPLALSSLLHFTHLLLQNLPCQIQPIIKYLIKINTY